MFRSVVVKLQERVVLFKRNLPWRALAPGRHAVWGRYVTEQRLNVSELTFKALPEVRALLDGAWFREVTIEAEKAAAANVISRREETAATRSLVNTARLMADQPILLRLKELEAMKDIAAHIDEVRIVVGAEQLSTLLPAQLLGRAER